MTQGSESVVVPCVPTEAMLEAGAKIAFSPDEPIAEIWSAMLAAAPSTSVREEETIRQVARKIEAALCIDGERTPGSMWASERGREQMMICARVAFAALVPSPDEGKRHG